MSITALKGFLGGSIIYNTANNQWQIIDATPSSELKIRDGYKTLAIQLSHQSSNFLPVGLNEWNMNDINCNGTRKLLITVVSTL